MAAQSEALQVFGPTTKQRSLWGDAFRRLSRNRLAMVGLALIIVLALIAVFAPFIAPYDYEQQLYFTEGVEVCSQYAPTSQNIMGVDRDCRDTFSRLVYGARISLTVGIFTQVIVVFIGVLVGGLAGVFGGRTDNALMRFTDATYAFPDLLLVILFAAVFREMWIGQAYGGIFAIFLAIGIVGWVNVARLVRGQILSLKERDFVLAAHAIGANQWSILWRHLVPNTLSPVIVAITFGIPAAIFVEASLSFIGIGIKPPLPSWGSMIDEGYDLILVSYWPVLFPAGAIALTMLCFTFLGDGLRDALDPRTRR